MGTKVAEFENIKSILEKFFEIVAVLWLLPRTDAVRI